MRTVRSDASHGDFLATNKQIILQSKLISGKLRGTTLTRISKVAAGRGAGALRYGRRRRCGEKHRRPQIPSIQWLDGPARRARRRPGRRRRGSWRQPRLRAPIPRLIDQVFQLRVRRQPGDRLRGHAARRVGPPWSTTGPQPACRGGGRHQSSPRYRCGRLHGTVAPEAEISSFELPIRRNERTSAAFPVEITGGGAARDGMTVVLRDMPEVDLPVQRTAPGRQHLAAAAGRPQQPAPVDLRGHAGRLRRDHRSDVRHRRPGGAQHRPRPPARHTGAARAVRRSRRTRRRCTRRSRPPMPPRSASARNSRPSRDPLEAAPQQKSAQKPQMVQAPQAGPDRGASRRAAHASGGHEHPRHGHARGRSRTTGSCGGGRPPRPGPASPTCPAATDGNQQTYPSSRKPRPCRDYPGSVVRQSCTWSRVAMQASRPG